MIEALKSLMLAMTLVIAAANHALEREPIWAAICLLGTAAWLVCAVIDTKEWLSRPMTQRIA